MKLDVFSPETIREHTAAGWWDDVTLAQRVAEHAAARPHAPAYLADDTGYTVTWR